MVSSPQEAVGSKNDRLHISERSSAHAGHVVVLGFELHIIKRLCFPSGNINESLIGVN